MFSNLGPLFKTTFRQAESNDTRQKIPHEERDPPARQKQEDQEKIDDDALWQDSTTVSIEALRNFLINFLATMPEAQNDETIAAISPEPAKQRPKEKQRPTNTHNAKAVRAYQSTAAHTTSMTPNAEFKGENTYRRPPSVDQIENKELRDIYNLIDNLDVLATKGVQQITIQKAGSFVESLKNAVEALL